MVGHEIPMIEDLDIVSHPHPCGADKRHPGHRMTINPVRLNIGIERILDFGPPAIRKNLVVGGSNQVCAIFKSSVDTLFQATLHDIYDLTKTDGVSIFQKALDFPIALILGFDKLPVKGFKANLAFRAIPTDTDGHIATDAAHLITEGKSAVSELGELQKVNLVRTEPRNQSSLGVEFRGINPGLLLYSRVFTYLVGVLFFRRVFPSGSLNPLACQFIPGHFPFLRSTVVLPFRQFLDGFKYFLPLVLVTSFPIKGNRSLVHLGKLCLVRYTVKRLNRCGHTGHSP